MISLTQDAVNKIKEISEDGFVGHFSIRVKLVGGGCASFSPDINFDNVPRDLDEVLEQDGITIRIDPLSLQYMDETTVDYSETLMGGGFKFNIPKATGSCGCNKSYSF